MPFFTRLTPEQLDADSPLNAPLFQNIAASPRYVLPLRRGDGRGNGCASDNANGDGNGLAGLGSGSGSGRGRGDCGYVADATAAAVVRPARVGRQ